MTEVEGEIAGYADIQLNGYIEHFCIFDLLSLQFNYDSGRDDYQDER